MRTILVVDDELSVLESFRMILKEDYRVLTAIDGLKALEILRNECVNLVILDIMLPGMSGLEVLSEIRKIDKDVEEIKFVIDKTLRSGELAHEVAYLRSELNKNFEFNNIVGQSPAMRQIFDTIIRVAKGELPVFITGERGRGKELIYTV